MENIPENPIMLFSYINTMLRDRFNNLDELCASLGIDKEELQKKLLSAGFEYMPEVNQFR